MATLMVGQQNAVADDVVINSAVTSTILFLTGNNTITITETGSIKPPNLNGALGILGSNNIVTNRGTIQTSGAGALGIQSNATFNVTISNVGTILTSGSNAHGIQSLDNVGGAVVSNSGVIRTNGVGAAGIEDLNSANSMVANTGLIVSQQSDAIRMNGTGGTLNMGAPGYLGGAINFVSYTTLNVTTGPSHSVSWWLPTTNIAGGRASVSGDVPWFYDTTTGQFATIDPSGFAGTFNQLGDTANLMGRLSRYGLSQTPEQNGSAATALGYTDEGEANEGLTSVLATNSGPGAAFGPSSGRFWINGFGGYIDQRGRQHHA